MKRSPRAFFVALALLSTPLLGLSPALGQGTAFTYQGRLTADVNPAGGSYDFQFTIYDAVTNGNALAGPLTNATTSVSNGLFTALLDFGAQVFNGDDRWLEIGVRPSGSLTDFTTLAPRQLITPAPLALAARNAATAATATSVAPSALPSTVPQVSTASDPFLAQGFESPTFPPSGWTTGGNASWERVTDSYSEGTASAKCGAITNSQTSYLELTYSFPSFSVIRWDWKVSSEANYDWLQVTLDDATPLARISGSVDWRPATLTVAPGQHTVRWSYSKDGSVTMGSDRGWIDNVQIATSPGTLTVTQAVAFPVATYFATNVGIGTTQPRHLLHIDANPSHGEGMEIDASLAGHAPAIYLNHGGPFGRIFRIASYCDNAQPGSFRIRDDTLGADRLTIDAAGNSTLGGTLGVQGLVNLLSPVTLFNGGIAAELNSQLINIGVNDGTPNRFGGQYASAQQGGFLRIDARSTYPLFAFYGRQAGVTGDVTELAAIVASPSTVLRVNGSVTATAFNPSSDRNLKEHFQPLDIREVLDKVLALPLSQWTFKQEPAVRHVGPMAQDFHAAFGLGADDKHIATVDADGVALAAIQGLNEKVELSARNSDLRSRSLEQKLQDRDAEIAQLKARLETLERLLNQQADAGTIAVKAE